MNQPFFQELETPRLHLRALRPADENSIFAIRSDPQVLKYLDKAPAKDLAEARQFIGIIAEETAAKRSLYWVIDLKANGEFAGTVGLWNFSGEENSAEVGYALLPDFQGKGIMGEALAAVLAHGFSVLRLASVSAYTKPENLPSVRLLEQFGFAFEGLDEGYFVYRKST